MVLWPTYPQHPLADMALGPLEIVLYGDDLDPEARPLQVLADGADVRGPLSVEAQEWENPEFPDHPEQLLGGVDVEDQVELIGVEEQEVRDDGQRELMVLERQAGGAGTRRRSGAYSSPNGLG